MYFDMKNIGWYIIHGDDVSQNQLTALIRYGLYMYICVVTGHDIGWPDISASQFISNLFDYVSITPPIL
jgi:hypothetical protein